ncbi:SRR1-domain-containing protein, partial [Trametes elegans]
MLQNDGSAQFGYDDHFTPARTRKKRKNRPQVAPPSPAVLLDKAAEELAHGDWLRDTLRLLRESLEDAFAPSDTAPDVLCLGLGSPTSSRDARAQLAFLLAACDDLSIDRTNVSVFDPVFTDQDTQLLAQLRLTPLPEDKVPSYALRSPTIVFMPHCDLHLYENILRENWSRTALPNALLIANRLSEYAESIPSRKLASEHPCVARLAPYLSSRPLRACAAFPTAFNNTSIQYARPGALAFAERDARWWTLP